MTLLLNCNLWIVRESVSSLQNSLHCVLIFKIKLLSAVCFYLFLTVPCGLRDLSSPPRNRTYTLSSEITEFWPLLCAQMLSHVQLCATPWTVAHQSPLSMGFSRQDSWSGLLCPLPGDLPDPGIKRISPWSPALAGEFFTTCTTWKAQDHQGVPEFLFYWQYKGNF